MPISYGKPQATEADIEAVVKVLRSDFWTQGPVIPELEKQFAAYVGVKYAVACANGTAALHLCALALEVKAGDRWIVPSMTFAASANCIRYCQGEVVFTDIAPETWVIDLEKLRNLLESHPKGYFKGLVVVDYTGFPVDRAAIAALATEYELRVIEDACHAVGGIFEDVQGEKHPCGNGFGADLAIFSFHPVKHIASGEGGMVTTNDEKLYERLCFLRTHGLIRDADKLKESHGGWYMEMQELGYNYRLSEIHAALALSQLARMPQNTQRRQEIADRYDRELAGVVGLPPRPSRGQHAWHLYVIRSPKRKELFDYLRSKQIFVQVHYLPVHLHPYYQDLGAKKGDCPISEDLYAECLSLPMYHFLTDEEQTEVIQAVKNAL